MEKYLVADKTNAFYKQCAEYVEKHEEIWDKAVNYMSKFGISGREEIGITYSDIYVRDTEENREKFKGMLKKTPIDGFLAFSKRSAIGKGWTEKIPFTPSFGFDILPFAGNFQQSQFIFDDKLYIRFIREFDFKIPEGFAEIKASEYFKLCEVIKENKLEIQNIG